MKKHLKFLKRLIQNLDNYRKVSKPQNGRFNGLAGEPIITANVIIVPKTMPTYTNRLFIPKLCISQLKTDCIKIWKRYGRIFKGKIGNFISWQILQYL